MSTCSTLLKCSWAVSCRGINTYGSRVESGPKASNRYWKGISDYQKSKSFTKAGLAPAVAGGDEVYYSMKRTCLVPEWNVYGMGVGISD